jgi:large subunit ribosomal protein L19
MALKATHKEINFGVGDEVKVFLKVKEGEKTRSQIFDGMVIGIKGRDSGKSFTVRKIGAAKVGIEMIFPINTPSLEKIEVVRHGTEGVQHAKLYYTRNKSSREIEKIYSRAGHKNLKEVSKKKKVVAKKVEKKEVKKAPVKVKKATSQKAK